MDNPDLLEDEEGDMDASQDQQEASDVLDGDDEMEMYADLEAQLDAALSKVATQEPEQQLAVYEQPSPEQPSQEQLGIQHKRRPSDDMLSNSRPQSRAGQLALVAGQAEDTRKRAVFEAMTEDQRNRYEAYCRAAVPRKKVKKLVQVLQGNNTVNDKALIAISSITKMFLGEVVERARILASQQGHEGALLPSQLRQAYAELQQERKVPHRGPPRPLFR